MIVLDDQILRHPKLKRAIRLSGGDAVFLWLGLRAYCAQQLTDGHVPTDMLTEVDGPDLERARNDSLVSLKTSGLVHGPKERAACIKCQCAEPGRSGIWLHDYLQWADSREEVLKRREANRQRQRKIRGVSQRDNTSTNTSVTTPSPLLPKPNQISPPNPLRPREQKLRSRPEAPTESATPGEPMSQSEYLESIAKCKQAAG